MTCKQVQAAWTAVPGGLCPPPTQNRPSSRGARSPPLLTQAAGRGAQRAPGVQGPHAAGGPRVGGWWGTHAPHVALWGAGSFVCPVGACLGGWRGLGGGGRGSGRRPCQVPRMRSSRAGRTRVLTSGPALRLASRRPGRSEGPCSPCRHGPVLEQLPTGVRSPGPLGPASSSGKCASAPLARRPRRLCSLVCERGWWPCPLRGCSGGDRGHSCRPWGGPPGRTPREDREPPPGPCSPHGPREPARHC